MPVITLFAALTISLAGGPSGDPAKNGDVPADAARDTAAEPMLERILQAFDKAQRETTSLVAGFTEKKELKLLARPVLSRGELCYNRPNQVRWEYLEPDRKVFVITEDMYLAYYPALKRAEEVPIKKFVGKRLFRFLGLGSRSTSWGNTTSSDSLSKTTSRIRTSWSWSRARRSWPSGSPR